MTQSQDSLYTSRAFAPLRREIDIDRLAIEGDWPSELAGMLYQVGPNPRFDPLPPYNPLLGDGMVHAFHVSGSRVSYRNRWVRTQQWQLENDAGRALFATSGDPRQHDPSVARLTTDGVANTNLVWHGGRLLALEEGHAPIELDPQTLDTIGVWTFHGALEGNMTAHPKIDPATGEMILFANFRERRYDGRIHWYVVAADGHVTRRGHIEAPYPALVHDFAVTRDFLLFPVGPVTVSVARARAGGPALAWESDKPAYVGVVSRTDATPPRWVGGETCFAWHVLNAWNQGNDATLLLCAQSAPAFPSADGSSPDPRRLTQHLTAWQLDAVDGRRFSTRRLSDEVCEYPRMDDRFAMTASRFGYVACHGGPGTGDPFHRGIGAFTREAQQMTTFHLGSARAVSEPVFVPRAPDAAEGDGFLLCLVYDERTDTSALTVFDASAVDAGPIGRARVAHRVPMGFHLCWRPDSGVERPPLTGAVQPRQ